MGTWDDDARSYTIQYGLTVPSINIDWRTMLIIVRELKQMGYSAHRMRDPDGEHVRNDPMVLIERTDGMSEREILHSWER